MDEKGQLTSIKISWYDYILYLPIILWIHVKTAIKFWWKGLGNDW